MVTDRTVQEALRRIGRRAGGPGIVTCRDLRRTSLSAAIASGASAEVVATLADHHPRGTTRASQQEALAYQLSDAWVSPLDFLLEQAAASRRAA